MANLGTCHSVYAVETLVLPNSCPLEKVVGAKVQKLQQTLGEDKAQVQTQAMVHVQYIDNNCLPAFLSKLI